ncbi:MAG: hypothetical protein KDA55_06295 [Planctomycetales bacterium]|nr:hypothetical protein [Planctomycetales bacterium]
MPRETNERFVHAPDSEKDALGPTATPPADGEGLRLTDEQMERWAQLLADGDVEFPPDLLESQVAALVNQVQLRRRRRLIQWLAREIARYLQRENASAKPSKEYK